MRVLGTAYHAAGIQRSVFSRSASTFGFLIFHNDAHRCNLHLDVNYLKDFLCVLRFLWPGGGSPATSAILKSSSLSMQILPLVPLAPSVWRRLPRTSTACFPAG